MSEAEQFRTVTGLLVLTVLLGVGLGWYIAAASVTEANSYGLPDILKGLAHLQDGLVGALLAMLKQSPHLINLPVVPQQEKQP